MKRLLKISLDTLLITLTPVLVWFVLGLLVDSNLINVFSIAYPIQFIWMMLKSIFTTGSNISAERNSDKNEVYSSMYIGIAAAVIVCFILVANVENYITFMNMDVKTYKAFTVYAIYQPFLALILEIILNKLYYEEKNDLANQYSMFFNLINLIIIILLVIIFENYSAIIGITLLVLTIYTIIILIKNTEDFEYRIKLIDWVKYDAPEMINNFFYFLIFLFGFSNAFEYGAIYTTAIAFISLITDSQWDVYDSITTVAKIDVSKNCFNYKNHLLNAYKLFGLVSLSSVLMFIGLFYFYNLNLGITLAFLCVELICWVLYPITSIKTCYLQIDYSTEKVSSNEVISNVLRTCCSFLKTPFCTAIGQILSSIYSFVTINLMYKKANIKTLSKK